MADLSEYLGHILCEVTRARVMADLESVKIAREYVRGEGGLLRTFPVPRMRLPDLEITVPVVVGDIPEGYVESTTAGPQLLARMLASDLGPLLEKDGIHVDTAEITKIIEADPDLSRGRLRADLADTLSAKLHDHTRALKKPPEEASKEGAETAADRFRRITGIIREQVVRTVDALPRRPVGIPINGKTAAIKETGDPRMVVNVKMVIKEESMEILVADQAEPVEKQRISRLVPE